MSKYKTIVVDDEPHARNYIKTLLDEDDEISIIAQLKNGREAKNFIKDNEVDIAFMDIQMPGLSGIDVLASFNGIKLPIIVFTTAFDQYAVKAFELNAVDYLLKPFNEERFYSALDKVKSKIQMEKSSTFSRQLMKLYTDFQSERSPHLEYITIKNKGLEEKVFMHDVHYIESSSVYVMLHTDVKKQIYRVPLSLMDQELDPSIFLRVHRSVIVNTAKVKKWKYLQNNRFEIQLGNGHHFLSSRSYKDSIRSFLEKRS